MPRDTSALLPRLEAVRHRRPGAREAKRLLRAASRLDLVDAAKLIRFHEALLFLRAYPHGPDVLRLAERLLSTIEERVAKLAARGEDLDPFDAPEVAGIAGTTIGTDFSFDLVRWLRRCYPRRLRIDWEACDAFDRMRSSWPEFLPLLEEEALADANVPYLTWLAAAAGPRRDDAGWLLDRYERMRLPPEERAERWDSLGVPVAWDLAGSRASRTKMRVPGPPAFFHDAPLLSRRDVSLDAVLAAPRLSLRRLTPREGLALCDTVRAATSARYREFYTFTYADPASVVASRPGRGVEIFLIGIEPERRLPLRAAYGGFVVKNGVPVGYIEGLAFFERLEIGFNMYYTFREGESAWIYAQVLKLHRDALGVSSFSIDPYQLGHENDEAIESGAFWFYRKLGFRPTNPEVRAAVEREERRLAADPGYRSSARTLRRLVTHNMLYEAPGTRRGDWDQFHIRNLGLAINRRMCLEFSGNAESLRAAASRRVAAALGLKLAPLSARRRAAFEGVAPVLDLIPDLPRWSRDEREALSAILRAKAEGSERRYLRLLQHHTRLRGALLPLGSGLL